MRAVRYPPHGEVLGDVLELTLGPRSHQQTKSITINSFAVADTCEWWLTMRLPKSSDEDFTVDGTLLEAWASDPLQSGCLP
jgi:hypothetical protein